jgi:peptidoglycan/xylan/chitin deacetylase (PgdA/CDA1 family)
LAKPISIEGLPQLRPETRYVAVTFDDGLENLLENAIPELEQRGIPSTIFVPTELLGQFPPWVTNASDRNLWGKMMSSDQLKALPTNLISLGSHGMTHAMLPSLREEDARRELTESRQKLEDLSNRRVTLFSFPFGAFNECLVTWCREAGYERVFTSLPKNAFTDPKEFVSGRVWVEPTDWRLEFRLKVLGAYGWLPLAIAVKRRALLTTFGKR